MSPGNDTMMSLLISIKLFIATAHLKEKLFHIIERITFKCKFSHETSGTTSSNEAQNTFMPLWTFTNTDIPTQNIERKNNKAGVTILHGCGKKDWELDFPPCPQMINIVAATIPKHDWNIGM